MVLELTSSADILNSRSHLTRDINIANSKFKKAQSKLVNLSKYSSRLELDKSHMSRKHDEVSTILGNIKVYNIMTNTVAQQLEFELRALNQLNNVIIEFEKDYTVSRNSSTIKYDYANRILSQLNKVLRFVDNSGEFVWGGRDKNNDPLSLLDSNNRITIDLVNLSNLQGGLGVNNFSITEPNENKIQVSLNDNVRESFLYAGHDAVVKTISYINMRKANAKSDMSGESHQFTDNKVFITQQNQYSARNELKMQIGLELDRVSKALEVNQNMEGHLNNEIKNLFANNLIEDTQQIHDNLSRIKALTASANASVKVSDIISELHS